MDLSKLFGEDALTYDQFKEKVDAEKIKLADLGEGGYVDVRKHNDKVTELKGIQEQLEAANDKIKEFTDLDIDGIKKAAADWETKYNTDTQALKDAAAERERTYAAKDFLGKYQFSSDLAKRAALDDFLKQEFKQDGDSFLGADDYMEKMIKSNPGAFISEENEDPENHSGGGIQVRTGGSHQTPPKMSDFDKMTDEEYFAAIAK